MDDYTGDSTGDGGWYNPLPALFGLIGQKISSDAEVKKAAAVWSRNDALYGVDEYGRAYLRGAPSNAVGPGTLTSSPLLTIGIAVLAVTLAVWALKS